MSDVDLIKESAVRARATARNVVDPAVRSLALEAVAQAERADLATAEVKRLRVQLGCVKALATLWEETAAQIEAEEVGPDYDDAFRDPGLGDALTHVAANRSHAAALREMLSED